jgi:pimeloyl-ACP methyl ester carboxylesterase
LLVCAVLVAIALLALGPRIRVAYLTTFLLLELPTPETNGPIASRMPDPQIDRVTFEAAGRTMIADVYRPASGSSRSRHPGIVLNHGVAAGGMNDLRLINFADALARAGYVALVPEFINLKEFHVQPSDVGEMVGSYEYLERLPDVDPDRVGFFGFSYAGGLAVLAANDPRISERVRFCFLLGSYYDIRSIITYATTGYHREDGEWVYMEPRHTGKWAFLRNSLELAGDATDRRLLTRIANSKLKDETCDVSASADSLGEEGAKLYELMMNEDPDVAGRIIDSLSPRILDFFDELSMPGNIENVTARLIIVHGRDDNLMPYTESILLAENAPPAANAQLRILESLQHVDLEFSWEGGPAGWVATLAEVGRIYSVMYALLAEGLL